jgi:hypothetical protein
MDNARIHHGVEIVELLGQHGMPFIFSTRYHWYLIIATGVHLVFLPPYSPDLNPIEEAFSKIKAWIRRNNDIFSAATDDDLMYDMQEALNVITESDAVGYFIHAGYF